MSSEEMKNAILDQVKQCIQSELNSIVKPLEEYLASIKSENATLRKDLSDMRKYITPLSLHANANEQYSRKGCFPVTRCLHVHTRT